MEYPRPRPPPRVVREHVAPAASRRLRLRYGRDEGWLDAGLVIQFIIFGLMAVFFYLSANIAAVAGEAGRSERSAGASADEYLPPVRIYL